jgi:hypothetical protein
MRRKTWMRAVTVARGRKKAWLSWVFYRPVMVWHVTFHMCLRPGGCFSMFLNCKNQMISISGVEVHGARCMVRGNMKMRLPS